MDLFASLIPFLKSLLISSLAVIALMTSGLQDLLTSYGLPTFPTSSISVSSTTTPTSPAPLSATTTPAIKKPIATTTLSTPTPKKVPQVVATKPTEIPIAPTTPPLSPEEVNTNIRTSIVNILCTAQNGNQVRSISGSGVVIDSRGVVLTNAHIGQYFLLRDYPAKNSVDCVIRIGSPAEARYRATLLYLPPVWIEENAPQIKSEQGIGTGENDYAFLLITSTTNPAGVLPSSFAHAAMSAASPETGDGVLVAGYPAGFLDGTTIEKNLYASSAFTAIGQLYTFNNPANIDVVSLGGTVVSQGGSSGGAVVRTHDGKLVGLIATATAGTTTASRDLRAITLAYINRSLSATGKGGIAEFLLNDLTKAASDFAATYFIEEKKLLVQALER